MKKKIISVMMSVIFLLLAGSCGTDTIPAGKNTSYFNNTYYMENLNDDTTDSATDFYYFTQKDGYMNVGVTDYNLQDNTLTQLVQIDEDYYAIQFIVGFAVAGKVLFYTVRDDNGYTLYRKDISTETVKSLYTSTSYIFINIVKNKMIYTDDTGTYLNTIDMQDTSDSICLEELCTGKSEQEQTVSDQKLQITMKYRYSKENKKIKITEIRDENNSLFLGYSGARASVWTQKESKVTVQKKLGSNVWSYWINDGKENALECLNKEKAISSGIFPERLIKDNDKVVGMVTVSSAVGGIILPDCSTQQDVTKDVLFQIDTTTGKSSKIYDTHNEKQRIIGYQNGIIYLIQKGKIYTKDISGGSAKNKMQEVAELPKTKDSLQFTWVGKKLVVFDTDICSVLFIYEAGDLTKS